MKSLMIPSVLAFAVAGLSTTAFSMTPTPTYLAKAGAGDLFETQSSQLVLKTTKNAKVRAFAVKMITDHKQSTTMTVAAAKASGLTVAAPTLDAEQKKMIVDLTAATGVARDTLYLKQQHEAHEMALSLHKDYAATGEKRALKMSASKIVPVVEHHIATMPHS